LGLGLVVFFNDTTRDEHGQDWIGLDQDWSQFWPDQDWIGLRKFLMF